MPEDYIAIRDKFKQGFSMSYLAREYGVSVSTIEKVLDDNLRKEANARKNEWNKEQWRIHKDDIEWLTERRKKHQECKKYRASVQKDIYKYDRFLIKNNPKLQLWAKEYGKRKWRELRANPKKYQEHLIKQRPYQKEWRRRQMENPVKRAEYNRKHREYMKYGKTT